MSIHSDYDKWHAELGEAPTLLGSRALAKRLDFSGSGAEQIDTVIADIPKGGFNLNVANAKFTINQRVTTNDPGELAGAALVAGSLTRPELALSLVAVAGFVHGHAHGVEAPTAAAPVAYVIGFVAALEAVVTRLRGFKHGENFAYGV